MKDYKSKILLTVLLMVVVFCGNISLAWADRIKMAGSDWPVWQLVVGMNEQGELSKFDFSYEKYALTIDGFAKDKFDITFMTVYDFIATQRNHPNGVIIAIQDFSNGGDGVVLRPEFASSASTLKGQTIGLPTNAISLYLMHMYLAKNGMSLNDIKLTNIPGEFVSKAYISNKSLAGIAGWNPNLDEALGAGGKKVVTSADFPRNIYDCIVVNKESLQKNRSVYIQFLKDWFKAVNDPSIITAASKKLGFTADDLKIWLGDANIYHDAKSSLAEFGQLYTVVKQMRAFYSSKPSSITGSSADLFYDKPLDIDGLIDDSLLKEIQ